MIYIVGGSGYIGQRIARRLRDAGTDVTIVDLQAPKVDVPFVQADARFWSPPTKRCRIIYMASVQEPSNDMPDVVAEYIMVNAPLRLLHVCEHLVYFSSIRAAVLPNVDSCPTLYSRMKSEAELELLDTGPTHSFTILRPGTVFGGFADELPVRVSTVPNKFLITGEKPDNKYRAYVCPMSRIVNAALDAVLYPKEMPYVRTVRNIGLLVPATGRNIGTLLDWEEDPNECRKIEACPDTNELIRKHCK